MAEAQTFIQPLADDTQTRLLWKTAGFLYTGLGLAGAERVADKVAHTGKFWVFHAITDCVIASITYSLAGGAAAGDTIKAGDRVYGQIMSLSLTSGTGELYRASAP